MASANMKVGTRLGLGFGAVILLLVIIAGMSIKEIRGLGNDVDSMVTDKFPKTVMANNILDNINVIARAMRNSLLETDNAKIAKELERIEEARGDIKKNIDELEKTVASATGKALFAKIVDARQKYIGGQNKFIELEKAGNYDEAKTLLLEEIRATQREYTNAVKALSDHQIESMNKTGKEARDTVSSALTLIIALALAALIVAIAVGFLITRSLLRQLGGEPDYAAEAVHKIAGGDLSMELQVKSGDTTSLVYSLKIMQDSLRKIVAEIQKIVDDAVQGDFSTKMDMSGKAGYTKTLSELLNQLSDTVDGAFKDTIRVAQALANGDLSQKVTREYSGAYNQVKVSVNTTADSLTQIVAEIQQIVEAANRGDFNVKMNLSGKQGYTKTLSELLNLLSDTVDTAFKDTIRVVQALAQGDLTQSVTREYQGSFNDVKQNVNTTVDNLKKLVDEIKVAVESINTGAKEIAVGNADLSQRTEEQASSLEETASSMEELTSTVKQNADNAKQANQLAIGASTVAGKGGAVVNEVVTTMSSINESSRKIVDIISVIDGIAFQTNILALNAAVEAARAGEQGRGFAVVAAEVRNLAQRSAAAAKEIKSLIGDSVDKVENGTRLVGEAGQTMDEIVTSIKRVTDIMAEISAASSEQSAGIEQVNLAITQMDEVTQQNAALVEESAAAAESLEEQAQNLSQSVSVFKLDTKAGMGMAVTRRAATPATSGHTAKGASKGAPQRAQAKPAANPAKAPMHAPAGEDEWKEF
ncbi:chemotaxis protein [Sulfurimicrobium lacus]|uniref:Chemotaxis protein n=1 Tax=Sulfurimicrobium lacus TaxID=2715678 RepID=A0A6F8V8V9_9PROT|nr:methyl-accepting chemotaxis protein [Sulfurimicrobium lacus]BCB26094.1 chemotaxis protein [Sulfurimicrobium lacus]